jgi:hypothetical protein
MFGKRLQRTKGQTDSINIDEKELDNILRILTMLEKALDRLLRQNYHNRHQYPPIVLQLENTLNSLRIWIQDYKIFGCLKGFHLILGLVMKDLEEIIQWLIAESKPIAGKRAIKKKQKEQQRSELCRTINSMLEHIAQYIDDSKAYDTYLGDELEKALQEAFKKHFIKKHEERVAFSLSTRGDKTYIFACASKEEYLGLISDPQRFKLEVVDKLSEYAHATGHEPGCKKCKGYNLKGFRSKNRKPIIVGRKQMDLPIRMVQCKECKAIFSMLPSFLPREKHFTLDIIGHIFEKMMLFSQSIQSALQDLKITGGGKSKQTILNWLRWIGTFHPATILSRAGALSSGYFQEDEGFEKEPQLRTYSVFMVDPNTLLVWHADYIDHVDEDSLCGSFEKFLQRVSFKIIGVTKDKWEASTKALRAVFKSIWIGFCHRHCLKKIRQALIEYQKETKCNKKERDRLYKKFKQILESSSSQICLQVKIKSLDEPAFHHPLLQQRLVELQKNAPHYTCHHKRKGITKTTSMVDNFLKLAKRKLTMAESFRDKEYGKVLFQALATVRNFVPFFPGAKNAHKSPFMLAGGKTCDLPWIQVMNFHNAFLFTPNAF